MADRIQALADRGLLAAAEAQALLDGSPLLTPTVADKMVENVIGVFGLPFAVAPNFLVNGRDHFVPLVVEEPSIVAGLSSAAKLVRENGGFRVDSSDPILIGQIQLVDIQDPDATIQKLFAARDRVLALANELQPKLHARGGGARDIEYFKYRLPDGRWTIVLHLLIDTRDAMGANLVNSICEGVSPDIEKIAGARVSLKILSNLADRSLITARAAVALPTLLGDGYTAEEVRDGIVLANEFAMADPHRAATHNKGIMNGIDAVALATGNDWRAVEAGAHAFAASNGTYRALTKWSSGPDGELTGELQIPIRVGIVGGSLKSNPAANAGLRIAGVRSSQELAELMAAVGLAQNLAALRALVTHGIQHGHMNLHARSVALSAGAPEEIFDKVVDGLIASGEIKSWKATQLIEELQGVEPPSPEAVSEAKGASGSAAGKIILLGEHAAVYGKHVLALPLDDAVSANVTEIESGISVSVPGWGIQQQFRSDAQGQGTVASVISRIMQHFGVQQRGFAIRVESRIPVAMGLGASAALAVAVIRAFDALLQAGSSNRDVDKLAFECERITHGNPSGIDNNIATYAQPVLFSKGIASRTKPLTLAEVPPLVVAASGKKGMTREQVAGVRMRYERNEALYSTIFDEIDEISIAGAVALRECDYASLGSLMNVCHGLLNAIEVSTPELEMMIDLARRNGAIGAKLTGSGGGGSIVALCPDNVVEVARALRAAGFDVIRLAPE